MSRKTSYKATETSASSSGSPAVSVVRSASGPLSFTAQRKHFAAIVRNLSAVTDRRSRLPILGNIAIRASQDGVVLAATDLNNALVIEVSSWVIDGCGGMTVPSKALTEALRKLPDGEIAVRATETGLELKSGAAVVNLQGIPDRDFPKLPAVLPCDRSATTMELRTVDAHVLLAMVAATSPAICRDETRFHLNGISFRYDGERAVMLATDGHRLVKTERELPGLRVYDARLGGDIGMFATTEKGLLLNAKGCAHIARVIGTKANVCDIGMGSGHFLVRVDANGVRSTLAIKPIDAEFPPWRQVVPEGNRRLLTFNREELLGACERARVLCTDARGMEIRAADSKVALVADHPDRGTFREEHACELNACEFRIGVNPRYLADALGSLTSERVTLAFSDDDSLLKGYDGKVHAYQLNPMLVRSTDDAVNYPVMTSPYLCVVMPMRI